MAAQVDVEMWKRRTGLLQLRLSSVQEDVDMYAMRVRLLESEIAQESAAKAHAQAMHLTNSPSTSPLPPP
jgi:flagellin-like hook-associated protein FlgL